MPTVSLAPLDVDELDLAIGIACIKKSEERLECKVPPGLIAKGFSIPSYFYSRDECLVMSFDGGWYPFLDNTQGYNRPPLRWYIPKVSRLIGRIAQEMQTPEQRRFSGGRSGGRVFLHATGVLRRPALAGEIELLNWQLPEESLFLRARLPDC